MRYIGAEVFEEGEVVEVGDLDIIVHEYLCQMLDADIQSLIKHEPGEVVEIFEGFFDLGESFLFNL